MFGVYLINVLHDLTEGYDFWSHSLMGCVNLVKELDADQPATDKCVFWLIYLCNILRHRSQLENLSMTLACSPGLRKYFRNTSFDEANPKLDTVGNRRLPQKDNEEGSLISLLKTLTEENVFQALSLESDGWADEIVTLCQRKNSGERWMSNFATDKALESRDAIGAFLAVKRIWDRENLRQHYDTTRYDQWEQFRVFSDKLRAIDPKEEAFNDIVSKHMTPNPNLKFDYVGSSSFLQHQSSHQCGWLVYKTRSVVSSSATRNFRSI